MEIIKKGSPEWEDLKREIINEYYDGDLITKEWLRDKLCIEDWTLKDFSTAEEMKQAWTEWTFTFLGLMQDLKYEILVEYKICLRTIWGQGYRVVPAPEVVRYGYSEFVDDVTKAMKKAQTIFDNAPKVDLWNKSRNNDIISRFAGVKQMLQGLKKW